MKEEASQSGRNDGVVKVKVPCRPQALRPVKLREVGVRIERLHGRLAGRRC